MREAPHAPLTSAAIAVSGSYASGVAAMGADSDHVRWIGSQAVVTLPGHIDVSNASQICEELLSVINHGATELIADMTATLSCEHAGAAAVARLRKCRCPRRPVALGGHRPDLRRAGG